MPDRVKLANPGDELVMVVKAVKAETVERNDAGVLVGGNPI